MTKFSPAMLVPAQAQGKTSNARTAKEVLLANIAKQKHLFLTPDDDGKRTFEVQGDEVHFTLRVSNSAIVLGQYEQDGVKADVTKMKVPKAHFVAALDFYKEGVEAGQFDTQLAMLNERKEARTSKLRSTRAAKKELKAS